MLRSVKSRAMYGEVKRRVDRVRSQPGHAAEAAANGQEKEKGGAVALYQAPDMMAGAARLGGTGSTVTSALAVSGGGAGAGLFPLNQRCSTFMISCSSAGTWADRYCRYLDIVDIWISIYQSPHLWQLAGDARGQGVAALVGAASAPRAILTYRLKLHSHLQALVESR